VEGKEAREEGLAEMKPDTKRATSRDLQARPRATAFGSTHEGLKELSAEAVRHTRHYPSFECRRNYYPGKA
jgi:hypothetical protein